MIRSTDHLIFLDIDGVMVPHGESEFSTRAVAAIRSMTGHVVLISTWRSRPESRERAELMFKEANVPIAGWVDFATPRKGGAIAAWLYENFGSESDWPTVTIIDDQATPDWLPGANLIVPDSRVGLVG
jgi:hypothetical protein